jgi:hypothetical protein
MMAFGLNSIFSFPVGLIADVVGERTTLAGLSVASLGVVMIGMLAMRAIPRSPIVRTTTESGVPTPGGS